MGSSSWPTEFSRKMWFTSAVSLFSPAAVHLDAQRVVGLLVEEMMHRNLANETALKILMVSSEYELLKLKKEALMLIKKEVRPFLAHFFLWLPAESIFVFVLVCVGTQHFETRGASDFALPVALELDRYHPHPCQGWRLRAQ